MQANNDLIERVYKFGVEVKKRNYVIANSIDKTVIPLLEYEGSLADATKEEVAGMKGVGPKAAYYISRILSGENVEKILEEVPYLPRAMKNYGRQTPQDSGEFSGSWDNAVGRVEGD